MPEAHFNLTVGTSDDTPIIFVCYSSLIRSLFSMWSFSVDHLQLGGNGHGQSRRMHTLKSTGEGENKQPFWETKMLNPWTEQVVTDEWDRSNIRWRDFRQRITGLYSAQSIRQKHQCWCWYLWLPFIGIESLSWWHWRCIASIVAHASHKAHSTRLDCIHRTEQRTSLGMVPLDRISDDLWLWLEIMDSHRPSVRSLFASHCTDGGCVYRHPYLLLLHVSLEHSSSA
jgi:hypothetical protein